MKFAVYPDSCVGFKYPDTSNYFATLFFGDTVGLEYNNYKHPDSFVLDVRHKNLSYKTLDGDMKTAKITKVNKPITFGVTFQVFELSFLSGLTGRVIVFEIEKSEKLVLLEWNQNHSNVGFLGQIKSSSAVEMRSIKKFKLLKKNKLV